MKTKIMKSITLSLLVVTLFSIYGQQSLANPNDDMSEDSISEDTTSAPPMPALDDESSMGDELEEPAQGSSEDSSEDF